MYLIPSPPPSPRRFAIGCFSALARAISIVALVAAARRMQALWFETSIDGVSQLDGCNTGCDVAPNMEYSMIPGCPLAKATEEDAS